MQFVEAHGTGTTVGDPIEAAALGEAYGKARPPEDRCVIGSIKSNLGHLEAAAGITGLIKTALCLQHRQIPKNLHFETRIRKSRSMICGCGWRSGSSPGPKPTGSRRARA